MFAASHRILRWRMNFRPELVGRMPTPTRIVQDRASERDEIGLATADDVVCLPRVRDESDCTRDHARGLLDLFV